MLCGSLRDRTQPWLRDYVEHQSLAVILIYAQIGCALIGSLGALYNGVLLINLVFPLFALVAIESNSQSLGRTYALLLFSALLLDVSWFILFTQEIWRISAETYGTFFVFSVRLTMAMEMVGFFVSFLNPPTPAVIDRQCSEEEIMGGSIYDPPYYASLFDEGLSNMSSSPYATQVNHYSVENNGSPSAEEGFQIKSTTSRSLHAIDEEKGFKQPPGMSSL